MGGLFGGGKTPKTPALPKPPPPPPPPEPLPLIEAAKTEDEEIKKARRRSGWEKTMITGALTPTPTGKKTVLG